MTTERLSPEINRRDFIKFVFGTASAAAVAGSLPLWPKDAMSRPVAEPVKLLIDEYNYLVDPYFDFNPSLPTYREFLSLNNVSESELRKALEAEHWRFEYLLDDPDNWSVDEVQEWLDSDIQFEDMSPWNAAQYTEYADGIRLYESLPFNEALELDLSLVEGDIPGSDFCGVYFGGDVEGLNKALQSRGINVVVS